MKRLLFFTLIVTLACTCIGTKKVEVPEHPRNTISFNGKDFPLKDFRISMQDIGEGEPYVVGYGTSGSVTEIIDGTTLCSDYMFAFAVPLSSAERVCDMSRTDIAGSLACCVVSSSEGVDDGVHWQSSHSAYVIERIKSGRTIMKEMGYGYGKEAAEATYRLFNTIDGFGIEITLIGTDGTKFVVNCED